MPTEEELAAERAAAEAAKQDEKGEKGEEEPFDKERAMATIRKQRQREQELTEENKRLKAADEKRKTDELSEAERTKKRLDELDARNRELESEVKTTRLRTAFLTGARKLELSFVSDEAAEDAFRLADLTEVVMDDGGKVTAGLEPVLKDLAKSKSYLFSAGGGADSREKKPGARKEPPNINSQDGGGGKTPASKDEAKQKLRESGEYAAL